MITPKGPGSDFKLLFTHDAPDRASMPAGFIKAFGGDWHIPDTTAAPYVYTNFAASRDGRVSFNEPGVSTGGDVTGFNPHDRWLMGLLRARADCVLMGDSTVKVEVGHIWTAEYIAPDDAAAFNALRAHEGRSKPPMLAIISYDCMLSETEACFEQADAHCVIATTAHGFDRAMQLKTKCKLDVLMLGEDSVDLRKLVDILHKEYKQDTILCEGGPRVMGGMLAAGQVSEEFLTYCPMIIGENKDAGKYRPSYVEGAAFLPGNAPQSHIHSLRVAGDYLFLQTKVTYRA